MDLMLAWLTECLLACDSVVMMGKEMAIEMVVDLAMMMDEMMEYEMVMRMV